MVRDVREYVQKCEICEERKNPPNKKRHFLQKYVVGGPFERIATDIAGPFPTTERGNRYILVVGDYFTKLTEAYPVGNITAETVADVMFRAWIKRYGCPVEVHSDQGRQYESTLFLELCRMLQINKTRTTPLHPRSDGMIERMNRTIQDMLSKYIKSHQKDWDLQLDYVTLAYNSTPHESTGLSPHKMVFGREIKLPLDVMADNVVEEEMLETDFVRNLKDSLCQAHEFARKSLQKSSERQKQQYDLKVREKSYQIGQLVWRNQKIVTPGRKQKICRHWNGPWIITKKISEVLYKIQHKKDLPGVVVHGYNVKEYKGEKKINWFNRGIQEETLPTELPNLEAFKNTNDPQSTSDTELESESGAELESGKNTELGSGSSAELESGIDAELGSGSGAELRSGNEAELRSGTKSAIIINRNESRFGRSIKKPRKAERLHTELKDGRSEVSDM